VSSTQLQIAVSASDMAVAGTEQIAVTNAGRGSGISGGATFTVNNPAPQIATE